MRTSLLENRISERRVIVLQIQWDCLSHVCRIWKVPIGSQANFEIQLLHSPPHIYTETESLEMTYLLDGLPSLHLKTTGYGVPLVYSLAPTPRRLDDRSVSARFSTFNTACSYGKCPLVH